MKYKYSRKEIRDQINQFYCRWVDMRWDNKTSTHLSILTDDLLAIKEPKVFIQHGNRLEKVKTMKKLNLAAWQPSKGMRGDMREASVEIMIENKLNEIVDWINSQDTEGEEKCKCDCSDWYGCSVCKDLMEINRCHCHRPTPKKENSELKEEIEEVIRNFYEEKRYEQMNNLIRVTQEVLTSDLASSIINLLAKKGVIK